MEDHSPTALIEMESKSKWERAVGTTHHSPSKEEVVFIHVEFSRSFQYFWAHLEREKKLVAFKQTTAGVSDKQVKYKKFIVIG